MFPIQLKHFDRPPAEIFARRGRPVLQLYLINRQIHSEKGPFWFEFGGCKKALFDQKKAFYLFNRIPSMPFEIQGGGLR